MGFMSPPPKKSGDVQTERLFPHYFSIIAKVPKNKERESAPKGASRSQSPFGKYEDAFKYYLKERDRERERGIKQV